MKWAIDEVLISKTAALTVCPDEYFHLPPGTGPE